MNAATAKRRQQLIWNTLIGLKVLLVDDQTLLQELDPDQERLLKDLIELGAHKLDVQI